MITHGQNNAYNSKARQQNRDHNSNMTTTAKMTTPGKYQQQAHTKTNAYDQKPNDNDSKIQQLITDRIQQIDNKSKLQQTEDNK